MPADAWAVQFPVGKYSRTANGVPRGEPEQNSGTRHALAPVQSGDHKAGWKLLTREPMLSQSRIDDTVLVREAQHGSRPAFEELVRHYDQAVLRLALHLTGSEHEAQDIYQDAFLKAYKNIGSFRFECSFYTWIYRIVTNLCLDHLRKKNVRKEDAPVAKDSDGGEYDLLDQVADARAGANPERDLMRRQLR